MPTKANDEQRQEKQARLGPLGIIGLNDHNATRAAVKRLTSKEPFEPGYAIENEGARRGNTLMIGLGSRHHSPSQEGKEGVAREQFIQEIIDKGRYSAPSSGQQNPTLYLAIPYITDAEAEQIAQGIHREVCYSSTELKLVIDSNGDLHFGTAIDDTLAFMSPFSEKKVVPGRSVYYPRDVGMNAIADRHKEAPTENSRIRARRQLGIAEEDGCLEIITKFSNKEDDHKKRLCSSDLGGGGHQSVAHYSGQHTTLLDMHGFIPHPSSRKDHHYNQSKIEGIIVRLKLSSNGEAPLAVFSGCDTPAAAAAHIASKIDRPLLVGNNEKVILTKLKNKGKPSGDFKMYCSKGFSIFYPKGGHQKINSNFILLPRTLAMSHKVLQEKEILEQQFLHLKAGYVKDLQKINEDHFNVEEMKRLKLERTGAYRAAKKELMLQLEELGYVMLLDKESFVPKIQPDDTTRHSIPVVSPPQRRSAGCLRR